MTPMGNAESMNPGWIYCIRGCSRYATPIDLSFRLDTADRGESDEPTGRSNRKATRPRRSRENHSSSSRKWHGGTVY